MIYILDISLDPNKSLSETYLDYKKETGEKISYEEFIKSLQKTVFLWLRDILGIKLDLPNKFVAFRDDVTNHNNKDYFIAGKFYYKIEQNDNKIFLTNKHRITHIYWTKIGAVSDRDVSVLSFIETMGHEMAHYYYMVRFKRIDEGDGHGTVFKMILSLWNHILSKKGYDIKLSVYSHSYLAIINPEELSTRKA